MSKYQIVFANIKSIYTKFTKPFDKSIDKNFEFYLLKNVFLSSFDNLNNEKTEFIHKLCSTSIVKLKRENTL